MFYSIFLFLKIFIFTLFPLLNLSNVYKSCREALKDNNNITGNYQIQPINSGTTASISCELINENMVKTVIDVQPSAKIKYTTDSNTGTRTQVITYENLNENELKTLLRYSGKCSQRMYIKIHDSQGHLLNFFFLDGSKFILQPVPDGICHCLITTPCETTGNKEAVCPDTGKVSYNQRFTLNGLLSVSSNRLPLIKTIYGDIQKKVGEYVEHQLKPVECLIPMKNKIEVLTTENCFKDLSLLNDDNPETCIEFTSQSVELKLEYFEYISIFAKNNDNLEIQVYSKMLTNFIEVCEKTEELKFTCKNKRDYIYIFIIKKTKENIKLCEIIDSMY